MIHRLSLLLLLVLVLACFAISIPIISAHTSTSDTTTSHISNFRYVEINIIDTSNTTTNTFLPQLNGTIINLAENDMCTTPVFAAACNRTNNVDLLLRSTGSGTGTTKDISVLSIFQCISIWGPSRCTYDDGYTRVTYNQPQSSRPDTYTVHVLTQHFGCPCSRLIPNNTNTVPKTVTITSILLAPTYDFITVRFSAPIAASTLQSFNTSVPLNTLLTSAGIARLGTGATARWIDSTTLVFRLGTSPSLSDDLGLLPGIFSIINYPHVSVTTYPLISTADGFPIRFDVTVRDEVHPDVFCSNIVFTITGLWSRNRSDITLHVMRGNTPFTNFNYTLTPGNNTDVTVLTLPSTTWSIGTYSIHLAVPSPLYGTRQYMRTIDIWRLGSCECTSARPEYYECRDCANPATPCLNNGTCTINPALNVTSMSPANATSRSTCTKCSNGYYGAACQFPPPCGLNNTNSSVAAVCGPHGLTCTNSADAIPVAICTCEQDWSGAKCTIMSEAWTYVTIRLLYNYSSITNHTQFSNAFANEMGTALKRNPALFVVKSLRPGSTIVEFGIQPDRNNSVPSRAIYNEFMTLFRSNSTNGTFTGPILSTLDRSFLPIVIHDCNADGCTSAVPASGPSTDDDDWKLGVGLGVGLGGACLLLTCLFLLCRRRPEETTTTTKEVAYPSSVPMTTPAPVAAAAAAPIPVTTIKQVDVPADTAHHTHDEEKAHGEQTAEGAEKRTVVFHV